MIYAIAAVLVLILDQAVKFWTTKNILLDAIGDDCVSLIPGVLHMTNVHNYGAAFSILENARWLLIVVSVVFVVGIIILLSQEIIHTRFGKWTAVLVMAGALGNCIDRILYGYVVDMFELELFTFAVFNVADIFITVCGILFCVHVILYREPVEVRNANESAAARRRREEREAKEAPYAAIPHRGEHKSLEEELRIADPDDPFAEWNFEDIIDDPAPGDPKREQPEEESADGFDQPQPRHHASSSRRQAEEEPEDSFNFDFDLPQDYVSSRKNPNKGAKDNFEFDDLPQDHAASRRNPNKGTKDNFEFDFDPPQDHAASRKNSNKGADNIFTFDPPQPRQRTPRPDAQKTPPRQKSAPAEEPVDDPVDGLLDSEPAEEFSLEDILSEFEDFE